MIKSVYTLTLFPMLLISICFVVTGYQGHYVVDITLLSYARQLILVNAFDKTILLLCFAPTVIPRWTVLLEITSTGNCLISLKIFNKKPVLELCASLLMPFVTLLAHIICLLD